MPRGLKTSSSDSVDQGCATPAATGYINELYNQRNQVTELQMENKKLQAELKENEAELLRLYRQLFNTRSY